MFSYDDYREIIRIIKAAGLQADYGSALHRDKFIIEGRCIENSEIWNPSISLSICIVLIMNARILGNIRILSWNFCRMKNCARACLEEPGIGEL